MRPAIHHQNHTRTKRLSCAALVPPKQPSGGEIARGDSASEQRRADGGSSRGPTCRRFTCTSRFYESTRPLCSLSYHTHSSSTMATAPITSFDTEAMSAALPALHPLASLTKDELKIVSATVKAYRPNVGKECLFRRIYLMEMNKKQTTAYLAAKNAGLPLPPPPPRRGQALFYYKGELPFMECIVDIGTGRVIGQRVLEGMHGAGDDEEMYRVATGAMHSPMVQKELERLQLPPSAEVVPEPWPCKSLRFES